MRMFKISKSLGFLLASVFLLTLGGCAPDRADPSVMNVQFHNQLRSDCLQLDLKISTLNPDQIRALSQCLNSHGDLGPINDLVQSSSNQKLSIIANWVNQEILSQPFRLSSLEKIFIELSRRGIIDEQFLAIGSILNDERVLDYITDHFKTPSDFQTFTTRESLLSLSEMGAKLFSSPRFIELKPLLTDLVQTKDIEIIFDHQKELADLFNKTHEAISISHSSPFIELTLNTQKLLSLTEDAGKTDVLKKIIAQTGLLMRSGKLKNILFIISKLIVSKQDAVVTFNEPTPIGVESSGIIAEPGEAPTASQISTEKEKLSDLFSIIQKNNKIADATLRAFSQFQGREKPFSEWIITHHSDLRKIEELVIQSDLDIPLMQNPAIKFMHMLGLAEQSPGSKSVEQTYIDISRESSNYKKVIFAPGVRWITPVGIKKRMSRAEELLPAIGDNLGTIGIDFFRVLFFELDAVSTKKSNGLRAVTAFAHANLITGLVTGSESLPVGSPRLMHIMQFLIRNSKTRELSDLLKTAVSPAGQRAFFTTYDQLASEFERTRAVGSNASKLLALAGLYEVPSFDRWLLSEFKEVLLNPSGTTTESFLELLSHPVVSFALQD